MRKRSPRTLFGLSSIVLLAFASCTSAPPPEDFRATQEVWVENSTTARVVPLAVALVTDAQQSVIVAAERLTDTTFSAALLAAAARGVNVKVLGDADYAGDAGFVALTAAPQANLELRFVNGAVSFLVNNAEVTRPGDTNILADNFVVSDELQILFATGGFLSLPVNQIANRVTSELLARDLSDEFAQMYAGVTSTALSAFSGPIKSNGNNREYYLTNRGPLYLAFGPQERLAKRWIDDAYSAKASVWLATEQLTSEPMAEALLYKANAGFDVRVVVPRSAVDFPSSKVRDLAVAFANMNNATIRYVDSLDYTLMVVDESLSPVDGQQYRISTHVLNHGLFADTAFLEGETFESRQSDSYTDGLSWTLVSQPGIDSNGEQRKLVSAFSQLWGEAGI